jgi:hypothetical protein
LAVTEPFVYEDQKQINGFPGWTGFSREEAGSCAIKVGPDRLD